MGIAYRCDTDVGCTFIVWDRDVTPDQWRAHSDRLFADPAFPPGSKTLADLSQAGGAASINDDVVTEIATAWRARGLGQMQVAVVPNGALDKARQFQRDVEGLGVRAIVFNDVFTACTWLDIDTQTARTILDQLHTEIATDAS